MMAWYEMIMEPTDAFRLHQTCLEGYLIGLAEAGWTADPQQVLFSSLTATFYRYLYGGTLGEMWTVMRDERNHPMLVAMFGVPSIDVLIDKAAANNAIYLEIYQQISQLLKQFA
jgi:hypothetical protein